MELLARLWVLYSARAGGDRRAREALCDVITLCVTRGMIYVWAMKFLSTWHSIFRNLVLNASIINGALKVFRRVRNSQLLRVKGFPYTTASFHLDLVDSGDSTRRSQLQY